MQSRFLKTVLLTSGAAIAVTGFGGAALAQGEDEQVLRDAIIVTARKREENLQDVPISITAITQQELVNANSYGLEDIAELTPGLQFRQIGGIPEVTIRGLAQIDQLGLQANVGTFIDGIFLNNRASIEFTNMDLAQVEVLKGPQSALFGRNTFAGAINYRSNPARLGEFEGFIQGQVGSHDRYGVNGSVNVPIADFAAVRVFGGYSQFDGTIENVRGGDNVGGWDERATFGATALFDFDRVKLKGFYVRNEIQEDNPATLNTNFRDNNAGSSYVVPDGMGGELTLFTINSNYDPISSVDLDPRGRGNEGYFWLAYGSIDIDLDIATLTGIISRSESEYSSFFDNIGDADAVNRPFFGQWTDQFFTDQTGDLGLQDTYEVRLASNPDSSPFDWLIGYSHFASTTGGVLGTTTPLFADPDTLDRITNVEERLIVNVDAIYGSFDAPITDRLSVNGEIRYTDEEQRLTDLAEIFFFPVLSRPLTFTETEFSFWSGRGGLDYRFNDDTLLYFYAARGVKSGGINGSSAPEDQFFTFDPETNWTYELGAKSTFMDGRGVINAAVYFIDWSDLQTNAPADLQAGPVIFNGIGATSKGFELDATYDVTDNFTVRLATTYIDATYDDGFVDAGIESRCGVNNATVVPVTVCSAEVGGNQIANQSNFQFFGSGFYTVPEVIGGLDGFFRAAYTYEAGRYPTSLNLARTPGVHLANFRAGLRNDRTEVALWVDNAFDETYLARVTNRTDASANQLCRNCGISSNALVAANGRTWGLTVRQSF